MRINFLLVVGIGLLGIRGVTPASAQTNESLSLAQAQQAAVERNWDILAARSDVDTALAQKLVAREFPNPVASFSTGKISMDNSHPNQGGNVWNRDYDSVAAINQLFEIGGKRKSRRLSAEAGLLGARARFADARRLLDLAVAQAYADVLFAEENARVLRDSAASLGREMQIAELRLKAGDVSTSDKTRIELTARQFELDAAAAETAAQTARIGLKLLLGMPKNHAEFTLTDTLESLATQPSIPAPSSQGLRPDITAAEKSLQKAEADLKLQKAMRVPDPTLVLEYEHQPLTQPHTVGIGVSFPLPLWNHNGGAIAQAQAARDQAYYQLGKARAQAAADLAVAQANLDNAQNRWRQYHDLLLEKSRSVRESISLSYDKGGASLLDLLSTQRDDNTVRLSAGQAAHDVIVAAAAIKAAAYVNETLKK